MSDPRPRRSVDPAEIADMALVEALFLQRYAAATASDTGQAASGVLVRSTKSSLP